MGYHSNNNFFLLFSFFFLFFFFQNKKIHYAMDLRHYKLLKEVQMTDSKRKKLKPQTKEKKRKTTKTKLIGDGLVVLGTDDCGGTTTGKAVAAR